MGLAPLAAMANQPDTLQGGQMLRNHRLRHTGAFRQSVNSLERFLCGLFAYPWLSSSCGDDADRVLDLASGPWYLGVNHEQYLHLWGIYVRGFKPWHHCFACFYGTQVKLVLD
jgi:hypothetical protein